VDDARERGRGGGEKGKRSAAKRKAGARRLGSLSRSGRAATWSERGTAGWSRAAGGAECCEVERSSGRREAEASGRDWRKEEGEKLTGGARSSAVPGEGEGPSVGASDGRGCGGLGRVGRACWAHIAERGKGKGGK
jgi:hypothetical protein